MKCVSLFSGAGGLDLGLEAAGFDIIASIEQDADCCGTLIANGRAEVIQSDISVVDFEAIGAMGSLDLLAGGPPCQPFSKSALWTHAGARGLSDPRSDTIRAYLKALSILKPRAFLLENVEGFSRWGGLETLKEGLAALSEDGLKYSVADGILSSADFGVPQKRRRFLAVGIRDGERFKFPEPSHGAEAKPYLTAWDACARSLDSTVEEALEVKGRWADLLPTIPPGKNYLFHTSRGKGKSLFGWRTRFWSFLYKLDPQEPSPTIVANPSQNSGPFHWQNRLLSTAELAALQTFPSDYVFVGNRSSRQRQIGNAVPPLLAERVGRALIVRLGGGVTATVRFELTKADRAPELAAPTPVPPKYWRYIGTHVDHPGAGRGPRPRTQAPATQPSEAQL